MPKWYVSVLVQFADRNINKFPENAVIWTAIPTFKWYRHGEGG